MARYSLTAGLFSLDEKGEARDLAATLEAIAAAGFGEVELMAEGAEWEKPGAHDPGPCREALERTGIYPHTIHTPLTNANLASSIEEIRRDSIARISDAMRYLGEVGGRTAIVHPTGHPTPEEEPYALENRGAVMERSHRSVSELVAVAEETGVRMALENLGSKTRNPFRPLSSMAELRAFIAGFPPEHVGLCLDTGHACISGLDAGRAGTHRLGEALRPAHTGRRWPGGLPLGPGARDHRLVRRRRGPCGDRLRRRVDDGGDDVEHGGDGGTGRRRVQVLVRSAGRPKECRIPGRADASARAEVACDLAQARRTESSGTTAASRSGRGAAGRPGAGSRRGSAPGRRAASG